MEPRARGAVVHRVLHSHLPEPGRGRRGAERRRGERRRRDDHGGRLPPSLPVAAAGLPARVRGEPERAVPQADGDRPADPPAARRRACRGRRGPQAWALGERPGGGAADLRDPRVPAERGVRRPGGVPPGAADAAAAAHDRRVRGQPAPRAPRREAAFGGDRLDLGRRLGGRAGVPAPQREGEARARRLQRRQAAGPGHGDRRRPRLVLRGAQGAVPRRREAEDSLPVRRRRRAQVQGGGAARRRRTLLPAEPRNVLDARAGARQPHSPQDGGQGRGGGEGEGGGAVEAGEERRGLRGARQEELGGFERRPGRRPRLLRSRAHGEGVRRGRLLARARRHQRPRQDAVRVPHHQGRRQEAGDHAFARRRARRRSPTSSPTSARRRRPSELANALSKEITPGRRISTRPPGSTGSRCRSRASSRATSRSWASARRPT